MQDAKHWHMRPSELILEFNNVNLEKLLILNKESKWKNSFGIK